MATTTTQGMTNEAAFEVIGAYLSRHKADAFRALGIDAVQDRREGVRIWDLEGNSFINCRSSGGVFNFGHHPRFAVDALKAALDEHDMGDWLLPSLRRAQGAEALARILPGDLHYTFFTPSGAEAVEVACKLARGVTGKAEIVSAEHGYHGHVGFSLAMDEDEYSRWFRPLVPGVLKVPFGDLAAIERAVGKDTAAVCLETIQATAGIIMPPDDYLERVRNICDQHGALLILDEVISGFRLGYGGAQAAYGVHADLTTLGKIIGGGLPVGAYGGRRDIMQMVAPLGPVYQAGTLAGSPLAMRAGIATVRQLQNAGFYETLERKTARLAEGFRAALAECGVPGQVSAAGSLLTLFFSAEPVTDYAAAKKSDTQRFARFFGEMLRRGIFLPPSQFEALFVSAAHTDEDIERTIAACRESLPAIH